MIKKHYLSLYLFLAALLLTTPLLSTNLITTALTAANETTAPPSSLHSQAPAIPPLSDDEIKTATPSTSPSIPMQHQRIQSLGSESQTAFSPPISIVSSKRPLPSPSYYSGSPRTTEVSPLSALIDAENLIKHALGQAIQRLNSTEKYIPLKTWMEALQSSNPDTAATPVKKTNLNGWQVYHVLQKIGEFGYTAMPLEQPLDFSTASFNNTFPDLHPSRSSIIRDRATLTIETPNVEMMNLLARAFGFTNLKDARAA